MITTPDLLKTKGQAIKATLPRLRLLLTSVMHRWVCQITLCNLHSSSWLALTTQML